MSAFAIVLLCIQACLVQNAFSLGAYGYAPYGCGTTLTSPIGCGTTLASPIGCGASIGPYGAAPYNNMYPYNNYIDSYGCAPYGGAGAGNVAVAGELPVGGTTFVAGQVPIIGGVEFGGAVPAAGAVTITGACACGCGPYGY